MPDVDLRVKTIKKIASAEYPAPAKRPMNTCFSTDSVEQNYRITLPDWRVSLRLCMEELAG